MNLLNELPSHPSVCFVLFYGLLFLGAAFSIKGRN